MLKDWIVGCCAVAMLMSVFGAGCADPNRELCRKACQTISDCDKQDGNLDDAFLDSCNAQCEEADQINESFARCISETDNCDDLTLCAPQDEG